MTNLENLNRITGENETPEESALKSLLAKIYEDYENEDFKNNYDKYLAWYHGMLDWLKSEFSPMNTKEVS